MEISTPLRASEQPCSPSGTILSAGWRRRWDPQERAGLFPGALVQALNAHEGTGSVLLSITGPWLPSLGIHRPLVLFPPPLHTAPDWFSQKRIASRNVPVLQPSEAFPGTQGERNPYSFLGH